VIGWPCREPIRVGLIVNLCAGAGAERIRAAARRVLEQLAPLSVVAVEGGAETGLADEVGARVCAAPSGDGTTEGIEIRARRVLDAGVDLIVGVGGDGTLCDIAAALFRGTERPPLLGVGMGSANVGPLVSIRESEVASLARGTLHEEMARSVDAYVADEWVGCAFNDVVVSNSFFGTRKGRRVDLDAGAKLSGETRETEPATVCTRKTWIAKNGQRLIENGDGGIRQVLASPINNGLAYAGKAISGLMCWAPYVGNHGVLAAASQVMIRANLDAADIVAGEPLHLRHVSFGVNDVVEVGGMTSGAVLVLDGNPMRQLGKDEAFVLRLRSEAIRVLRPGTGGQLQEEVE